MNFDCFNRIEMITEYINLRDSIPELGEAAFIRGQESRDSEIKRLQEYEKAIKESHNGYDPKMRTVSPGLEKPETPKQAIEELIQEAVDLALAEYVMEKE